MVNKVLKFVFQVPKTTYGCGNYEKTSYSNRAIYVDYDESRHYDCFDNALNKITELGGDLTKNVRWTILTRELYVKEAFDKVIDDAVTHIDETNVKCNNQVKLLLIVDGYIKSLEQHYVSADIRKELIRMIIGEWVIRVENM